MTRQTGKWYVEPGQREKGDAAMWLVARPNAPRPLSAHAVNGGGCESISKPKTPPIVWLASCYFLLSQLVCGYVPRNASLMLTQENTLLAQPSPRLGYVSGDSVTSFHVFSIAGADREPTQFTASVKVPFIRPAISFSFHPLHHVKESTQSDSCQHVKEAKDSSFIYAPKDRHDRGRSSDPGQPSFLEVARRNAQCGPKPTAREIDNLLDANG